MSKFEPTLKNKVSDHLSQQVPEFVTTDHPLFNQFVKYYYQFLEAGELSITGSINNLLQETVNPAQILDEEGEEIVLEDSSAKFIQGETITGQQSKATASVLIDDIDDNNRLFITSQQQFITGEQVIGSQSGAFATVTSYRGNPIQNIQQLLEYANVDNTVYDFLDKFRDSFLNAIPNTLAPDVERRKLIKSIKDLYAAKGTKKGHELFFRILFDEDSTISYPRVNMLRASDGEWSSNTVMRVLEQGISDANELIGSTITGEESGATAVVMTVGKFRESSQSVVEMSLDNPSLSGTFVAGETITGTSQETDLQLKLTAKSAVIGADISNRGLYYTQDQVITIASAGNGAARVAVNEIGTGGVDEIVVDGGGTGYAVDDAIIFNNSATGGTNAAAKVSVVGGGFVAESGDVSEYAMDEGEDHIVLESFTAAVQSDTYFGDKLVIEEGTFTDLGVADEATEITDVRVINPGNGYTKLPTVTVSDSSGGADANVIAKSNSGVGSVNSIKVLNFGLDYDTAPSFTFLKNILVTGVSGTFTAGNELTSHTGTVVSYNETLQILTLNTSETFSSGDTITDVSGATATVNSYDAATATAQVGVVGTTEADFISDRGKISADPMRIQDSFFYQDFSYVVTVAESILTWRNSVKKAVHPAGWALFGQIQLSSTVSAAIQVTASGVVDSDSPDTFTPELASTFTNLFATVFRRRLGTTTDGTSLRASPAVGLDPDDARDAYDDTERDLTLNSDVTVSIGVNGITTENKRFGMFLSDLPRWAFSGTSESIQAMESLGYESTTTTDFDLTGDNTGGDYTVWEKSNQTASNYPGIYRSYRGTYSDGTNSFNNGTVNDSVGFTIEQFSNVRIDQVSAADGSIPDAAYNTRIRAALPSEIVIYTT